MPAEKATGWRPRGLPAVADNKFRSRGFGERGERGALLSGRKERNALCWKGGSPYGRPETGSRDLWDSTFEESRVKS
ncbi:hypothetical protein SUGI_0448650 [Cryptomeria japonica]|nr:hypothetical protein SUGI_0448650 [Cryptomeria japonica]